MLAKKKNKENKETFNIWIVGSSKTTKATTKSALEMTRL